MNSRGMEVNKMSFIISGRVLEENGCRLPKLIVSAVNRAGKVLGFRETVDDKFELIYEEETPHDALLIASQEPLGKQIPRENRTLGIVEGIATEKEWTREGEDFIIKDKELLTRCCCIIWAQRGYYTVTGKVIHKTLGIPLPGVKIEAQDFDPSGAHDMLGSDITDSSGRFTIRVPVLNFISEDFPLLRPDIRFRVTMRNAAGKECECLSFEDDIIRWDWPNCKPITLPVECCLVIVERVGGMDAHLDPTPRPGEPKGRGIDDDGFGQGQSADGSYVAQDSPFGGLVTIYGAQAWPKGVKYRISVARWMDNTTPPTDGPASGLIHGDFKALTTKLPEMVYSGLDCDFFPPFGFVCRVIKAIPPQPFDSEGFYDILHNKESGGLIMHWFTQSFEDGKYSILLTIKDGAGCEYKSYPVVVRVDNKPPTAKLLFENVQPCDCIDIGTEVTGNFTAKDEDLPGFKPPYHFMEYSLMFEGGASGFVNIPPPPPTDNPHNYGGELTDRGVENKPFVWMTAGLPPCGYRVVLRVWKRTIVNNTRGTFGGINYSDAAAYFRLRA